MPADYSYGGIFRDSRDAAIKMQQMRATEIYRQMQLESLDRERAANELYRQNQQQFQQRRYMEGEAAHAASDAETNRIVNETNPPAAVAVTPPGGDPAWTDRANAMRDRFLRANPTVRPGPPQPYTGGASMLPHVRPLIAPTVTAPRPIDPAKARAALQAEINGLRTNLSQVVPLDQVENATGLYPVGQGGEYAPGSPDMWVNGPQPGRVTPQLQNARGVKAPRTMDAVMEMYRELSTKKKALADMGDPTTPVAASPEPSPPGSGDGPATDTPQVLSRQQRDQLPSGAEYIGPDGKRYRRQ